MQKGWLVNDCLTCIPNTKTFWHDLLEGIPGLEDKTNGYTDFYTLPNYIEDLASKQLPDYVIRNCTFFRKLNIPTKTISLLQDFYPNDYNQLHVAQTSSKVVFNSEFTFSYYKHLPLDNFVIIPLGVDSDIFLPIDDYSKELDILDNSILFVGSSMNYPKGFDTVLELIHNSTYNFCLVMKDDFKINHPRVKVFNKVDQSTMVKIYNSCKLLICTSLMETQHLGGIEAGMCNIPIIATNVGVYYNRPDGDWGIHASSTQEFLNGIEMVLRYPNNFSPRTYFINNHYTKTDCIKSWNSLIENL